VEEGTYRILVFDQRRIRSDLIDTYKIYLLYIYIYIFKHIYFFDFDQSGRRGHSKKLFKRSLDLL